LPDRQESAWFRWEAGLHGGLNGGNLLVLDWGGRLSNTYKVKCAGNGQQWKPMVWI
jgi:hypothetical protein